MLPSVVKNKIEQIWLDVIAGGVSQPTEVIEQLTYLMFAKQIDEREADIEMAELLSGEKQSHIFGESREEQALRWRNFKGMEARALHKHFVDRVFIFLINLNSNENSAFSRYLKHATFKINEPLALQKVVAGLEDLFENDIKDLDMQGDLYEYMLGKLNSAGRLGAFRTPKHIRDGLMLSVMTGGKNLGRLKRYVVGNANILLKECATIPDIKVRISELKELVSDHYWDVQDVLKFEETRKSLREIMKYIPAKKEKLHYSNFKDIVVFREEGRLTSLSASDFEDYRAKVNEYVEAHKTTPAINKLLHNEPISVEDYNELERIFTVELGTAEDYEMNYQDTPFGLLIRKIAKMDRTAAYAAFSTFILEERPNTEQLHFIEQVVDYVVENGYINNVLDLMKTPFDRPYKFSLIFTYEEQVKFVKIINNIKNNALVT